MKTYSLVMTESPVIWIQHMYDIGSVRMKPYTSTQDIYDKIHNSLKDNLDSKVIAKRISDHLDFDGLSPRPTSKEYFMDILESLLNHCRRNRGRYHLIMESKAQKMYFQYNDGSECNLLEWD